MKRILCVALLMILLTMSFTGCAGKTAEIGEKPTATQDAAMDVAAPVSMPSEEKPPLVIYHISDDEIELHFTSKELASNELIAFLAPTGDENGSYNTSVNLKFERADGEIRPFLMVFTEAMDVAYTVDTYSGEMKASVEGNTLICHIKHQGIISPFAKSALWHIDTAEPLVFEGIITDDVSAIVEPVMEGFLPEAFKRSEYDDQYFKPESDDFIVVSYEVPIQLLIPEWYLQSGRDWHYGAYLNTKDSTAKITYLISYVDDKYASTKLRLEFASVEDTMTASLAYGYDIVPVDMGLPNEADDSLVTAEYFESCDQKRYGALSDSDHEIMYHGHFDQFRYFEYKVRDTLPALKTLMSMPLTENSDMLSYVPMNSLTYSAASIKACELLNPQGNVQATTFSSKRTHEAGSDEAVLDTINDLPGDNQYFTPITDDYAYVLKSNYPDQGDGYFNQEAMLYSFDSNGNIIQYIYRRQYSEFLSDTFEGEEFAESFKSWAFDKAGGAYYIDYVEEYGIVDNLGGMNPDDTPKEQLIQDLVRYGQHEGYYFSKP